MIKNSDNITYKILNFNFPFIYFIFIYNQFIIQNYLIFKIAFSDFFITYITLAITYFTLLFFLLKKNSRTLLSFFTKINLILFFLLLSNIYKYIDLTLVTKLFFDFFFLFTIILISTFFKRDLNILIFFFTILLLAKIIPNIFKTINYLDKEDIKKVEFFYEYEQNENKFNNVYHIILDGFQGNLYPEIKLKKYFDKNNFIYYKNYYSKYRDTEYATKNLFNGFDHTFYEDNNFFETDGWCKLLRENKIFVEMYVLEDLNRRNCSNNFINKHEIFKQFRINKNIGKNKYFDVNQLYVQSIYFSVFYNRLLPSSLYAILGKYISTDENSLFDPIMLMPAKFKKKINITNLDDPITTFFSYLKFVKNEKFIEDYNTYKHIHLLMPHAPFVFNRNTIKESKSRNQPYMDSNDYFNQYIDQSYFALHIMKDFIEKLKELGKFNESMIIIHADHGYDFVNIDGSFEKHPLGKYSDIEAKSNSLLLVKYPNSIINQYNHELYYQNEFIAKLILDNFKIKNKIINNEKIIFFENNKHIIKKNTLTNNWD